MTAPRFFCDPPLAAGTEVRLPDALAHYAGRVLRLAHGTDIVLFDGRGGEYPAVLEFREKQAYARIASHNPREAELHGRIRLAQGLATGDKMDWIVEKAVELGATELTPIAARHSTVQLRGERLEKRLLHWRRIAQAASEQCGRNRLMTIEPLATLEQCLQTLGITPASAAGVLLCHPDFGIPLGRAVARYRQALEHDSPPHTGALTLLVGPEGGWSDAEVALAQKAGVQAVRFGSRVLRTETAGLALIAACTALLGWNDDAGPGTGVSCNNGESGADRAPA